MLWRFESNRIECQESFQTQDTASVATPDHRARWTQSQELMSSITVPESCGGRSLGDIAAGVQVRSWHDATTAAGRGSVAPPSLLRPGSRLRFRRPRQCQSKASFPVAARNELPYTWCVESVIRNVRDLERHERRVYESVLGEKLREDQKILIQVIDLSGRPAEEPAAGAPAAAAPLPEWCRVYEGLSDQELAEVEDVVLARADLTRPSE